MWNERFHFGELIGAGRNCNQHYTKVSMCMPASPLAPAEHHRIAKVLHIGVDVNVSRFGKRERNEIFHRQ